MRKTSLFLSVLIIAILPVRDLLGQQIPITTSSEEAKGFYLQGRDLLEKLRAQDARAYFIKAVEKDNNFALAYLNLAVASPTPKEFFENYQKAVALADNVSRGERLQIMVLKAGVEGEGLEQQKYAAELSQLYPNDERAQSALGNVYFGQQAFKKAVDAYEKALNINPDFSPVYNQLGYSYRALNQIEKAEQAFMKYIELIPDDPNPYDSYAELLLKTGKYDDSIAQYKKALAHDANFAASHVGIATNLNLKGDFDKARKQLEMLLGMAENDGQRRAAHFAIALSYVYEGDMQNALTEIETNLALAKAARDAAAMSGDHLNLGNILLESGQLEKAAEHYNKSTEIILQSDFSKEVKENSKLNAMYTDAVVAAKIGDFDKAQQLAKDFKSRAAENGSPFVIRQAHEAAGIVALEAKEFDAAIKELENASLQNPYNLFRLAQAYSGKGDTGKAKSYCKKAATFNAVNSMNQAFVQQQAQSMLASL